MDDGIASRAARGRRPWCEPRLRALPRLTDLTLFTFDPLPGDGVAEGGAGAGGGMGRGGSTVIP